MNEDRSSRKASTADKPTAQIAESLGLTIETVLIPDHDRALRVYKGANPIFVGTESAVREFLADYEKRRPRLFESSIVNYKE